MKTPTKITYLATIFITAVGCAASEVNALEANPNSSSKFQKNGDATVRLDCKSPTGAPLEFCLTGLALECTKLERGQYCTQYIDPLNARMWGPF
jgi:hypothetical protein